MNSVMKTDLGHKEKPSELENNVRVLDQINGDLNKRVDDLLTGYTDLLEWLIDNHPKVAAEYYQK